VQELLQEMGGMTPEAKFQQVEDQLAPKNQSTPAAQS
jgi:hypothetical protein